MGFSITVVLTSSALDNPISSSGITGATKTDVIDPIGVVVVVDVVAVGGGGITDGISEVVVGCSVVVGSSSVVSCTIASTVASCTIIGTGSSMTGSGGDGCCCCWCDCCFSGISFSVTILASCAFSLNLGVTGGLVVVVVVVVIFCNCGKIDGRDGGEVGVIAGGVEGVALIPEYRLSSPGMGIGIAGEEG